MMKGCVVLFVVIVSSLCRVEVENNDAGGVSYFVVPAGGYSRVRPLASK